VTLDKAGTLAGIAVTTQGPSEQDNVLVSLEERFGKPTDSVIKTVQNAYGAKWDYRNATWQLPEIFINFGNCTLSACYLKFKTPELYKAGLEAVQQRKQGDKL
jgi:hypothetical protein